MEEWKEYKIGDICRIKHGFAFKGIHFVDEPQRYVCVTPGNFALKGGFKNDKPKYYNGPIPEDYILQKDDLVVTMTDLSKNGDTLGYSALIPYDEHYTFLHNQRIGLIEDISTYIDKHFLYWVMRTYDYQRYIVGHCSGSTVKHTSPSGIGSYVFRCPDLKMQKEISSVLDNFDDKIEVNRRINDNLEQQAQALFKSWFVDFEPFRDQPFVESELGMIPEGWSATVLEELCSFISRGLTPKYDESSDELILGQTCVRNNIVTLDNARKHKPKQKTEKWVQLWDTLINSTGVGSLGRVGIVYFDMNNVAIDSHITVVRAKSALLRHYVGRNLLGRQFEIENMAVGSTGQTELPKDRVKSLPIVLPDDNALTRFNDIIEPIAYQLYRNIEESRRLAELRDTLLPRLMSGELSVDGLKGQFAVSPGQRPGSKEHVSNKTAL